MDEVKKVDATTKPKYTFLKHEFKDWKGVTKHRWCLVANGTGYKHYLPVFRQFNGCGGATLDGFMDFYARISPHYDFTQVWKDCAPYLYEENIEAWQMPRAYMLLNLAHSGAKWLRENGLVEICATPNVYHEANKLSETSNVLCYWDWKHLVPEGETYARYPVLTPTIVFKEKQPA